MRGTRIALLVALLTLVAAASASAAPGRPFTVMTWNIASAVETGNELDPIADAVDAQWPAVVAIQEVDRSWSRSDSLDQARELALRLGMSFAFDPNLDCSALDLDGDGSCHYGTAILSRYALRASATRQFTLPSKAGSEPRGLAQVGIVVGGRRVSVFNTHLSPHVAERRAQVQEILRVLARIRGPYVLMGDLNARPSAIEIAWLRRRLTDAATATRQRRPTVGNTRIDYVMVSRGVQVLSTRVPSLGVAKSDHRPLVARLRLR